jgi:RNA methyltransferase, TrmH family
MNKKWISSLQNPLVKHLIKLRNDAAYRYEQQSLVIEGIKPVQEVAPFIKKLIYAENSSFPSLNIGEEWTVSDAVFNKISGMSSPEGVLAEVKMPSFSALKGLKFIVALDGINDPGNLGTLLRTALALGWEGAFILPNSCDLFNEKALRSARGAHFRLPLLKGTAQDLKQLINDNGLKAVVGDLRGCPPDQLSTNQGKLLVLGNEAHGASEEIKAFCTKVTIPMPGEMESLNVAVAGGILMYILRYR